MRSTVEMKEKRLLTIEEKLNARERVSPSACSFLLSKCSMYIMQLLEYILFGSLLFLFNLIHEAIDDIFQSLFASTICRCSIDVVLSFFNINAFCLLVMKLCKLIRCKTFELEFG